MFRQQKKRDSFASRGLVPQEMNAAIRRFRGFQAAALGIVLLTVVTRLPSLQHPQAIDDEAPYSVVANELIDGGHPYIDAIDRKPPLLFWTYAAVFEIAGKYNWMALHVVALMWVLGTMAGLYVIGRRLFDRETGLIAALLYSVFQPWAVAKNLAFNGELLMNLPIVWAWAIAFGRRASRLRPELFAGGTLLGAAFLLKQPAAIAAVPLGLYLFLPSYRASRGVTRMESIAQAAILTLGFLAALGLVALILERQGILHEAFYWTFTSHTVPYFFLKRGVLHTLAFVGACLPLVLGAAMSLRDDDGIWASRKTERFALIGLLVASAVGVVAGARFYPHYYIQLIPPLALLAAPPYARFCCGRARMRSWIFRPAVASAWLAITVVAFSVSHWKLLARDSEPSETVRYLTAHSAPNDRIFVWGRNAADLYLLARRRPACRYILTFPLTGFIFGDDLPGVDTRNRIVPWAWNNLEEDFHKHPPAFIVDLYSSPGAQYPARDFPFLSNLLAEHYQPAAQTAEGVIYRRR